MRIVLALVLVLSIAGSAHAQRPVDAEIAQVREQVLYAAYPDAIAAGQALLARTDLDAAQRNAVLELVATAQIANRQTADARATLATLYGRDPDHRLTDPDASPPVVSAFARAREAHPQAVAIALEHAPPRLVRREPPSIDVRVGAGADAIHEVRLRYRASGEPGWSQVVMNRRDAATWTGRIPVVGDASRSADVAYYLVALAPSGAELAREGSEAEPLQLRIPAEAPDARAVALDATQRDAQQGAITGTTTPGRSIAEEPAFWIVIGLVVVGAAVGAGVGIALSSEGGPEQGTLGSVVLRH